MGPIRAKELLSHLVDFTVKMDVQILQGSKVIEVKCAGINKGITGMYWLRQGDFDFVLAMGDDWTDEDLFMALPDTAYTIKVGVDQSYARYNVRDCDDVLKLLGSL